MFPSLVWELLFISGKRRRKKRILYLFVDFQKRLGTMPWPYCLCFSPERSDGVDGHNKTLMNDVTRMARLFAKETNHQISRKNKVSSGLEANGCRQLPHVSFRSVSHTCMGPTTRRNSWTWTQDWDDRLTTRGSHEDHVFALSNSQPFFSCISFV